MVKEAPREALLDPCPTEDGEGGPMAGGSIPLTCVTLGGVDWPPWQLVSLQLLVVVKLVTTGDDDIVGLAVLGGRDVRLVVVSASVAFVALHG